MGVGGKLSEAPLKLSVKKLAQKSRQDCMEEVNALFSCFARNRYNDTMCKKEKYALASCATMAAKAGKPRFTINYHLQRLYRSLKR